MWTVVVRTESRNARWCGEERPEQQRGPGGTQHAPSKQRRTNVEALRGGRSVGWCGSLCLGGGGLYQHLEWRSSLMGLYAQVPATGETGVEAQLSGPGCWKDPHCTYVYTYISH